MEDTKIGERLSHEGNRNKITGFIDDLIELWKKAGRSGEIIRNSPFNEEMNFPRITYKVLKRVRNQDFKDLKPRFRTLIEHPYEPDSYMELWGQVFDVYVEFGIYASTHTEADDITEEFEDFIQLYKGTLRDRGVQEINFYAQEEDSLLKVGKLQIASRTLQYVVRLERLTPRVMNGIQQVEITNTVRNI